MTLTDTELINYSKGIGLKVVVVVSTELMNIRFYKNANIIINLDKPGNSGTHWVALCVKDGKQALYFDSFGVGPDDYVIDFCMKYTLKLCCNTYIIQDIATTSCGYYCVAFIKWMSKEKPNKKMKWVYKDKHVENFNSFINMFESDTNLNEKLLFKYITPDDENDV